MSEQIWQCVGCGRTFVEYVNGCPHHGDVEIAPRVETVTSDTPTREKDRMRKFRKKPVVIEAAQLTGSTGDIHAVYQWVESNTQGSFDPLGDEMPASGVSIDPGTGFMLIATLEGVMQAKPGDWIIRGTEGEFYPCKPDAFAATFEAVAE